MCRLFRNNPLKSVFLLIVLISSVHLTHKLFLTHTNDNTVYARHLTNSNYNISSQSIIYSRNGIQICAVNMSLLKSSIPVNQTSHPLKELESRPWATNLTVGTWSPQNCSSKYRVAIIIPYRDREEHLKIFLNHMHPFLQKQFLSYGIFVIEQAAGTRFNRAALFNVGYRESIKNNQIEFDCFIFHDVDLLPSNENNLYTCDSSPLHLSVAIDKFNYKLPYNAIFGGAVALSKKHILQINGFSNIFFGWGGEDDDISSRLSFQNLNIHRYPNSVARYIMVKHNIDKGNPVNPLRFHLLKTSKERNFVDGLNTLTYDVVSKDSNSSKLYRHITVQFPEKDLMKQWKL